MTIAKNVVLGDFCVAARNCRSLRILVNWNGDILTSVWPELGRFSKEDYFALDRGLTILKHLSTAHTPDKIITRGLQVLKVLRAVAIGGDLPPSDISGNEPDGKRPGRVKLDIPYFGTIYLERRAFADQSFKSTAAATTSPPTLPNTVPGAYYPSSSWMGTTSDPAFPSGQASEPTGGIDNDLGFDPSTAFWAPNSDFTFQAPCLADFNVNWDYWDMGL